MRPSAGKRWIAASRPAASAWRQVSGPLATVRERCDELLALMDLAGDDRKLTIEFSHGMKKKLALAGALMVVVPRQRLYSSTTHIFMLWMVGSSLLLFAVAALFMRNQVRPIRRLAQAADRFGKGRDDPDFHLSGATEVRQAAAAFIEMRDRIRRHVQQRTDMLSGVSHDLRTPLTRMKLELAMMKQDPSIQALKDDVEEMGRMLEEYLAFAKGLGEEAPALVDVASIASEVTASVARNDSSDIAVEQAGDVNTPARARALKRCLANLIDNAIAHGDKVRVLVKGEVDAVIVSVDDNGPGIPEELYEDAFRPFSRLDATRSRNQKGVGLGLAIARDVARSHGGDIFLSQSPLGGLRATLRLPRPA